MKHVALDTNVVLDYLLNRPNSVKTEQLFTEIAASTVEAYIPLPVFLECEWVLRTVYRKEKADVILGLGLVAELANDTDIPLPVLTDSIEQFRMSRSVSFVDCLIATLVATTSVDEFVTGDKKLARLYQGLRKRRRR